MTKRVCGDQGALMGMSSWASPSKPHRAHIHRNHPRVTLYHPPPTAPTNKKASRKATKKLMITARGEEEQLVVAPAQVIVPVWEGETAPQLPPPRELFHSSHTMDRLAKEMVIEAAMKQQEDQATA